MYVSTRHALSIVDELERQGFSLVDLCTRADVTPEDLSAHALRVPIDKYDRIVRAARELGATPDLGLRVSLAAPASALNVVGYIVTTCATIRDAFAQFLEHSALIKDAARWELLEDNDTARFVYEHPVIAEDNARFDAEACLVLVAKIGQHFGVPGPDLVRFRHAAPDYAAEYARVFRCDVRFGEATNELVFPRRYLDRAQVHHDERLRALLRQRAAELLAELGSDAAFVARVRDLLRLDAEAGPAAPSASRLAARLGVTRRTLERQVRERGASLAALLEEARRDAACSALRRHDGSIKRVAYLLGFSEPSAFHRAFKRWTGMTPAQYRAQRGADQSVFKNAMRARLSSSDSSLPK